jgi:glycosyltransferase involved in cell wall biosynthesis
MTMECGPSINAKNQLLVDVSVISKVDAETGIQRVVRNLYNELAAVPPVGYIVCPVAATRQQGYCYLPTNFLLQPKTQPDLARAGSVEVRAGDLFLALDLAAHVIPHRMVDLMRWKQQGVRICFFIYDLLPVIEPAWFNPKTTRNFRRWLRAVALLADDAVAISRTVQSDFAAWMQKAYHLDKSTLPCAAIRLGAELNVASSRRSTTAQAACLPCQLAQRQFYLMVGTIEPRKGHADVLDACEQVWATGCRTMLVIAGKQGWKVDRFMHRLKTHPEAGKRLHWLDGPSDEVLLALYEHCGGLIMASKGEGFGLPIVEAAHFNKPILARDIAVFREIAGKDVTFFPDKCPSKLLGVLTGWTETLASVGGSTSNVNCITWRESCRQLARILSRTSHSDRIGSDGA